MQRLMKSLLVPALLAVAPLGCMASDEPAPRQRPGMEEGVYRRTNYTPPTPPESVAKDIPLYGSNTTIDSPPPTPGAAEDGPPPVDTTGIKLGELPSVQGATLNPQHWQRAATEVEAGIDAPELKQNVREGLAVLAPRVARALIDFKGETAIVTVAVYRDTSPATRPVAATLPTGNAATRPATQPATQPTYNHAAVAIAFEGFAGQLDPSFIPRVLADQPRTPDDGREPIDFNLAIDRNATTYIFYQLTNDGLMAGEVSHDVLRRELAAAAEKATPSTTTRAAVEAPRANDVELPRANDVAGEYVPVPSGGGGAIYDSGEPWTGYDYGGYRYGSAAPYYGGISDPYLYDLYRCNWDSPYYVSRSGLYFDDYSYYGSGFYYGGGGYYSRHRHHHHDRHDRHDDHPNRPRDNDRPPIVISDRSPRGQVPWSNPPLVSRTNPPANANRGGTPLVIPAQPKSSVGTPSAARPVPTITGRPMPQPKEFVGPRAIDRTPSAAAAAAKGNARVIKPGDSASGDTRTEAPAADPTPTPIVIPARRPSTPYVAPTPAPRPVAPAPPIQRPSNRGSSAAERINNAPRLGPASNGNREFVGPRSNAGSSRNTPSNARSITGGGDSGGRGAASAGNGGGRSGGGGNAGGSRGGGDGGGGDGGGRSGNGGRNR